jgi:two-component system, OmpR family, response regulator
LNAINRFPSLNDTAERPRVLIVESDHVFVIEASAALERYGFIVEYVSTGQRGLQRGLNMDYAAIVLAGTLPDIDGLSVLTTWRNIGKDMPVLIVSERASVDERVHALRAGCDDYLHKPADVTELIARLNALIRRRHYRVGDHSLQVADLTLSTRGQIVKRMGREIRVSHSEWIILEHLTRHCGQVVTRERLLEAVSPVTGEANPGAVDSHIRQLRRKISLNGRLPGLIHTVLNSGYMLQVLE